MTLRARSLALFTVVVAALVSFAGGSATAAPAAQYPTWPTPPLGANDWTCRPTAERPHPAVIVHGTFGDSRSLLDNLSLALKRDGYCVYSLDYATGPRGPSRSPRSSWTSSSTRCWRPRRRRRCRWWGTRRAA